MFDFLGFNSMKSEPAAYSYHEFNTEEQWDGLLKSSFDNYLFVFKHSTRCMTSSIVLKRFEKQVKERNSTYYLLNVIASRKLSAWLEQKLAVPHQSPQLIVLKDGKVIAQGSHFGLLDILPGLN